MRWGVVTFPGSNDDRDARAAITRVLGDQAIRLWHKDRSLAGVDCVVLPGGFSYGD
jgi:phosphoribosylformylglycinamidine (FGAM) synthase-like amidotransferase family enzyme